MRHNIIIIITALIIAIGTVKAAKCTWSCNMPNPTTGSGFGVDEAFDIEGLITTSGTCPSSGTVTAQYRTSLLNPWVTINSRTTIRSGDTNPYTASKDVLYAVTSVTSTADTYYIQNTCNYNFETKNSASATITVADAPAVSHYEKNETTVQPEEYVNFTAQVDDSNGVDFCWFSINSSGSFVNQTSEDAGDATQFNCSFAIQLNNSAGESIGWRREAKNNVGVIGGGDLQTFTMGSNAPSWINSSYTSDYNGTVSQFDVYWDDDAGLSGFVFSFDNGSGTLVNDSFVEMTGLMNTSSVNKTLNVTVGANLTWQVYANDTDNNWASTDVFNLTTRCIPCMDNTCVFDYDEIFADVTASITQIGAPHENMIRFETTNLSCPQNVTSANITLYIYDVESDFGLLSKNMQSCRIENQTWNENINTSQYNDFAELNCTNTSISSNTQSTFTTWDITQLMNESCNNNESYFTLRFEHPSYPVGSATEIDDYDSSLIVGANAPINSEFLFRPSEWASTDNTLTPRINLAFGETQEPDPCAPPVSGTWNITQYCEYDGIEYDYPDTLEISSVGTMNLTGGSNTSVSKIMIKGLVQECETCKLTTV